MGMDAIEFVLRQLDDVWAHKWESVCEATADVSEAEADWQPPAYRDVPAEEGWPLPGTIRWHIAHMTHCNRYYALLIELRNDSADEPPPPKPRVALHALDSEWEALRTVQRALRATVAALTAEHLHDPVSNGMPLAEFLAMVIRHNTWHAGQMALLRRLYAAEHPATPGEPDRRRRDGR